MAQKQRFTVSGNKLVATINQLVRRGDARRICLLKEEERVLEIPISVGDPAAPATVLAAPVLAAIKAFSTLVTECTVEVEKVEEEGKRKQK